MKRRMTEYWTRRSRILGRRTAEHSQEKDREHATILPNIVQEDSRILDERMLD